MQVIGLRPKRALALPGSALWGARSPEIAFQRFGPVVLALGLLGLYGRKRTRLDISLVLALAAQLVAWLLFTHLYARFAVVLLIPLCLLAGRSLHGTARAAAVWGGDVAGGVGGGLQLSLSGGFVSRRGSRVRAGRSHIPGRASRLRVYEGREQATARPTHTSC